MQTKKWIVGCAVLAMLVSACDQHEIDDDDDLQETDSTNVNTDSLYSAINQWIYEEMQTYYYWEDQLPQVSDFSTDDPETFYKGLLYSEADKWSYITDDYESLEAELEGNPTTMGYSPAFYLYNNGSNVLIVVEYIYPGSPAETAGLKRGDIILTINDQLMDKENYYDLYSGKSYTIGLGSYSAATSTISQNGVSLAMTAITLATDPALYDTIFSVNGIKTGYLVYTEFISGTDNQYQTSLDRIFDEFATAGVTRLVVDLRYNPGGQLSCAGHLASAIAPANTVSASDVLIRMDYNEMLDSYFTFYQGRNSENLVYRFPKNSHNINLSTVYFLTTSGTASASELLISGLMPYMNCVIIGEATYGKYTGAIVVADENTPRKHNWAIMPIILKYSNASGYSDFADGLTPDYSVVDDLIGAVPFGDISDPQLAKALSLIEGQTTMMSEKSARGSLKTTRLFSPDQKIRRNLYIDQKKQ